MLKDIYQFPCPCCGKVIEIDTRSGRARAVDPKELKGGTDLDKLLQSHKKEGERLGSLFDSAKQQQQKQADRLAEELKRAKEAAKDDKDDRPRSPFDLD
jgi:hypothetical protein